MRRRSADGTQHALAVLALLALLCGPAAVRSQGSVDAGRVEWLQHRRALQSIQHLQQCSWQGSQGCMLNPGYVASQLTAARSSPASQLLGKSLSCAAITSRGTCEAAPSCQWDNSYADGDSGCFMTHAAVAAVQQACAQPQYAPSVERLHQCMAVSGSCQCSDEASCKQLLQQRSTQLQQLCPSVLGCWLSSLRAAHVDVTRLVQVHLREVLPQLEKLRSVAAGQQGAAGGQPQAAGRRRLMQAPMSQPVTNIGSDVSKAMTSIGNSVISSVAAAKAAALGQNPAIVSVDFTVAPPGSQQTVAVDGPLTGPATLSFVPESGNPGGMNLETGSLSPPASIGQGQDGLFDNDGSFQGGSGSNLGSAPQTFWACVASSAAAAKSAAVWTLSQQTVQTAGVAFQAQLRAATVPLQALDYGVGALECFKQHAGDASSSSSVQPMAEAYAYALLQLTRVFTSCRELYRQYASQAGSSPDTVVHTVLNSILPDAVSKLADKYGQNAAYAHDVVLQAQAVLTGMQWFAHEAEYLLLADSANAATVVDAYMAYTARSMLRVLQWLMNVQFGALASVVPPAAESTVAGTAANRSTLVLGAAYLPPLNVSNSDAAWQQSRGMLVDAVNFAVLAAWDAAGRQRGALSSSQQYRLAVDALASAHIRDLWANRVPAATVLAPADKLASALADRSTGRSWSGLVQAEVQVLQGAVGLVAATAAQSADDIAGFGWYDQMLSGLGSFLAAAAESVNVQLSQGGADAQAMQLAGPLANATAQCYSGPAAQAAPVCARLDSLSQELLQQSLSNVQQSDPLYQSAWQGLRKQWQCSSMAGSAPAACSKQAGCATGMLPAGSVLSGSQLVCDAANGLMDRQLVWNSTLARFANSAQCAMLLALPACSGTADQASCDALPTCSWQPGGPRAVVSMSISQAVQQPRSSGSGNSSSSRAGDCQIKWSMVSSYLDPSVREAFQQREQQCRSMAGQGACGTLSVDVDDGQDGSGTSASMAAIRIWVPVLAAAAVLGMMGLGVAIWLRRRAAAAREAHVLVHQASRRERKRKGPGKKRTWKRKISRAGTGDGQPDLMRDSFSDYLSFAPAAAAFSDAPDEGASVIGVGDVAGARSLSGASLASTVENPLNALHEEIGARLRLALPGLGLGGGWGGIAGANPLLAMQAGQLWPLQQQQQQQQQLLVTQFSEGQVSSLADAGPGAAGGGMQQLPPHRSLARTGDICPAAAPYGGNFSSNPLMRLSHLSQSSSASRGSAGGLSGRLSRLLRQRRAQADAQQGADDGMSDCHDSVRTFGARSGPGSGANTPALSLSRDSWASTELLVSPALTQQQQRQPPVSPLDDLL